MVTGGVSIGVVPNLVDQLEAKTCNLVNVAIAVGSASKEQSFNSLA